MTLMYEDMFEKDMKANVFYMITSDGTPEDGTGALLCRKHKNPKKAYIIQVPYFSVDDNEAGDYGGIGLIVRLTPVFDCIIDTIDYAKHIYYVLKKFKNIKWYEQCMGGPITSYIDLHQKTMEKIVYQLNVSILMIHIENTQYDKYSDIIRFFKRVIWSFPTEIYPSVLDHMIEFMRRRHLVRTIQRLWRRCIADPTYLVCRWRLEREFDDIQALNA